MDSNALKKKTISGIAWKFAESSLNQIVQFILSIILARLLVPEDYGIIALVTVFITICDKIVVSGLPTSLIQKKDSDNLDFSTVFYFSLVMSLLLYGGLYAGAPVIADFYDAYQKDMLVSVIRAMGLQIIIVAVNSVQSAYVSKTMQFKRFFWSTLGGTIVSAMVGIGMAYTGYGVWALVAQYLIKTFVNMSVLWVTVKWRPDRKFSISRFKTLFAYGWRIFTASMIKILYNDLRSLLIGKFYSAADLAFYNKGQSFPQMVESNIAGTIDSVFFPAMSHLQSSRDEMCAMLRRTIRVSTYILTPLLVGLAAVAEPLVIVLLTEKWLPCVFYLKIISFSFVLAPMEIENLQAIKAMGRSDLVLKLEIIKKSIGLVFLLVAVPLGVEAIAVSLLFSNVAAAVINAYPNRKLLSYTYKQQLADILPPILMSVVMYGAVNVVSSTSGSVWILLILKICVGGLIYVILSVISKNREFNYLSNTFLRRK